jgi:hypothetical protein
MFIDGLARHQLFLDKEVLISSSFISVHRLDAEEPVLPERIQRFPNLCERLRLAPGADSIHLRVRLLSVLKWQPLMVAPLIDPSSGSSCFTANVAVSTIDTSKVAVLPALALAPRPNPGTGLVLMLAREADSSWNDLLHALTPCAGILLMSAVFVISLPIVSLAGIS